MNWFTQRMTEPSTYAGFAAFVSGIVTAVHGDYQNGIMSALGGLAAICLGEKGAPASAGPATTTTPVKVEPSVLPKG